MHKLPANSESSSTYSDAEVDKVTCPECRHEFAPTSQDRQSDGQDVPSDHESHSLAVSHESPTLTQKAQRRPGSPLATTVRWLALATVLVAATIGVVMFVLASKKDAKEKGGHSGEGEHRAPSKITNNSSGPPAASDPALRAIKRSVVRIETGGPSGIVSLGSGFVVDATGLIATNYHVVSEATMGQVRFQNGTSYEIEGYASLRTSDDLAIVKIRNPPMNLEPLVLRTQGDPARKSEVIAVGHPDGVGFSLFNGRVSQVLETSRLPERSQLFLKQHLRTSKQHRWIQHTATLSEGNSGGPLLDRQGRVVGINTWVDNESEFGYALHVSYLAEALQDRLPKIEALEQYSTQEVRVAAAMQRLSVERVNRLFKEAKDMGWAPRSRLDYQTLQQLALAITKTRLRATSGGSNTIRNEVLESLIRAVDAIEADIEKQSLRIIEQLTLLNEFAMKELFEQSEGLIFVATVEKAFEGERGSRGMLVLLAGHEQKVFVPLNDVFLTPKPGTHYLIIGLNNGQVVRFGENPLNLEIAPVVVSRTILPLGQ